MKSNFLKTAAATGLLSLGVLAGSTAYASTENSANDAAELQAFLAANPAHAQMIADVEAKTGGKVTSAAVDSKDAKLIEFDVAMADGSEQELILNTADGTMTVEATEDGDHGENGDDDGDGEDEDHN